jgi:hypothetical protein
MRAVLLLAAVLVFASHAAGESLTFFQSIFLYQQLKPSGTDMCQARSVVGLLAACT